MLNQQIIIQRLALIKYLYKVGLEQSKQSETIASFSILSFHDSIEMFLRLLAEKENVKSDKFNFMDYWQNFPRLTLQESMKNLNARRVNIKHKGLLPSKSDIEASRVNTTDFFEQNTPLYFNVQFKEISMTSLISNEEVKDLLDVAQKELDKDNVKVAVGNSAIAFSKMLDLYEETKLGIFNRSHFSFGYDTKYRRTCFSAEKSNPSLKEFIRETSEVFETLQKELRIISLGIDYKRYLKFKLLTPVVHSTVDKSNYIAQMVGERKWTKDNCQYCIDFAIDSCLKLQEFDFDIREIQDEKPLEMIVLS